MGEFEKAQGQEESTTEFDKHLTVAKQLKYGRFHSDKRW